MLREGQILLDPLAHLEKRVKLEFLVSLDQQAEMGFLDQEVYQVYLALKVILVKMASREKLVLQVPKASKVEKENLDLLALLDLEDKEEKLDQLDPLVTKDLLDLWAEEAVKVRMDQLVLLALLELLVCKVSMVSLE